MLWDAFRGARGAAKGRCSFLRNRRDRLGSRGAEEPSHQGFGWALLPSAGAGRLRTCSLVGHNHGYRLLGPALCLECRPECEIGLRGPRHPRKERGHPAHRDRNPQPRGPAEPEPARGARRNCTCSTYLDRRLGLRYRDALTLKLGTVPS